MQRFSGSESRSAHDAGFRREDRQHTRLGLHQRSRQLPARCGTLLGQRLRLRHHKELQPVLSGCLRMGRRGYQQQRRPAEHLEFELQQHRQRQPGAFGHRGAGRTYHHEAQGQQRRSADLPGLFPFRTGKHVLHALQPGNSRELPGHTLYGPRRNRPQPQVRTRNAPGGLRDDRQRHRSGHPPDRRHGSTRLPSTISTTRPPAASPRATTCSCRTGTMPSNTRRWP